MERGCACSGMRGFRSSGCGVEGMVERVTALDPLGGHHGSRAGRGSTTDMKGCSRFASLPKALCWGSARHSGFTQAPHARRDDFDVKVRWVRAGRALSSAAPTWEHSKTLRASVPGNTPWNCPQPGWTRLWQPDSTRGQDKVTFSPSRIQSLCPKLMLQGLDLLDSAKPGTQ